MWDFSGDEFLFLWAAAYVTLVGAMWSGLVLFRAAPFVRAGRQKVALSAVTLLCLAALYVVLQNWADPVSVARPLDYVTLFMLGGAAWLFLAARWGFPLLGLSVRYDAI